MAEGLAPDHVPNEDIFQAYSRWAEGGWGALLTGGKALYSERIKPSPLGELSG